jgi:hypothetical protein
MKSKRKHKRLDPVDILNIVRGYHLDGMKQTELAHRYGTESGHISRIVHGYLHPWAWAQVADEVGER